MAERILIQDTVSDVYYDESYIGNLSVSLSDYVNALNDYVSDYSMVKVELVGLDYYTTNGIIGLSVVSNDYVSFDFPFYEGGSEMGFYNVVIDNYTGHIRINDGNLESGWTLKLYVEEEEEKFLDKEGLTHLWNEIKAFIENREPAIEVQGDWHYRIYNDGTFEAWYGASGITFVINAQSGNLARSDLQTLTLPTNLTNQGTIEIISFDVGVGHNNYPVFSTIANMSDTEIKYYVMSGNTRNSSPNYKLSAYVFGMITRN